MATLRFIRPYGLSEKIKGAPPLRSALIIGASLAGLLVFQMVGGKNAPTSKSTYEAFRD